jgi:2,5-diamino-6-(ribosylamino)-4(3H)-pyrimidinone 5'-phosphate reductase
VLARAPVNGLEGEWRAVGMESQPRPVILDPHRRAHLPNLLHLVSSNQAKSPWVFCKREHAEENDQYIPLRTHDGRFSWNDILSTLYGRGIKSIMIEGGASVINDVLAQRLADVVIITIAPVFLGHDGVGIGPKLHDNQPQWLKDTQTMFVGQDIVIAGRLGQ